MLRISEEMRSGVTAGRLAALPVLSQSSTVEDNPPASVALSSCFSAVAGVQLGRNCWVGRGTHDTHESCRKGRGRGLVVARRGGGGGGGYRSSSFSSSGGSRGRRPLNRPSPQEIDPALDIQSLRSQSVRLINEEKNMVGVVSTSKSIQMAEDAGLDLVIISANAEPPVVRIMDYSKYKYEQQKKKREQQKKSAASRVDVKELKMGYNIDTHDYAIRLRAAQRFLKDGDKVKVIVQLKGRENIFRDNAMRLIERFQSDLGEMAVVETKNIADRNMFMVFGPNKRLIEKSQVESNKTDNSQEEINNTDNSQEETNNTNNSQEEPAAEVQAAI